MPIREFDPADASALVNVFQRSVRGLGSRDYSPAQVSTWLARVPREADILAHAKADSIFLVATDDAGLPLAFVVTEGDGHIDLLYCVPEAAGTGVAADLYDRMEEIARQRRFERLFTEASEAARHLFARKGYRVVCRGNLVIGGIPIHNYGMEKDLRGA